MRLKAHREDVKNLRKQADAYIWEVADRYQRLIRMAEESLEWLKWKQGKDDPLYQFTPREKRVLRDAVHKS